jgi:hypothetical protein
MMSLDKILNTLDKYKYLVIMIQYLQTQIDMYIQDLPWQRVEYFLSSSLGKGIENTQRVG